MALSVNFIHEHKNTPKDYNMKTKLRWGKKWGGGGGGREYRANLSPDIYMPLTIDAQTAILHGNYETNFSL